MAVSSESILIMFLHLRTVEDPEFNRPPLVIQFIFMGTFRNVICAFSSWSLMNQPLYSQNPIKILAPNPKKYAAMWGDSMVLAISSYVPEPLYHFSQCMTKPTKWHVCPAKTQISLGIHSVWSESSLCAQWVAKEQMFLDADKEDG